MPIQVPQSTLYTGSYQSVQVSEYQAPTEGPRAIPIEIMWHGNYPTGAVKFTLPPPNSQVGALSQIGSLYVDNRACASTVQIVFLQTQLTVTIAPGGTKYVPISTATGTREFYVINSNLNPLASDVTRLLVLNVFTPPYDAVSDFLQFNTTLNAAGSSVLTVLNPTGINLGVSVNNASLPIVPGGTTGRNGIAGGVISSSGSSTFIIRNSGAFTLQGWDISVDGVAFAVSPSTMQVILTLDGVQIWVSEMQWITGMNNNLCENLCSISGVNLSGTNFQIVANLATGSLTAPGILNINAYVR